MNSYKSIMSAFKFGLENEAELMIEYNWIYSCGAIRMDKIVEHSLTYPHDFYSKGDIALVDSFLRSDGTYVVLVAMGMRTGDVRLVNCVGVYDPFLKEASYKFMAFGAFSDGIAQHWFNGIRRRYNEE